MKKKARQRVERGVLNVSRIARLTYCSTQTATRWCDEMGLRHYRLPGCGDRRVLPEDLVRFLRQWQVPVPQELEATAP